MAKFCTKCGKPLTEGQVCKCEKENVSVEQTTDSKSKNIMEQLLEVFKTSFTKPYDAISKTTDASYLLTAIITMVASVIGLCFVLVKTIKVFYQTSVNTISSSIGLGSSLGNSLNLNIDIFKIFLVVLLLVALFYFAYTGVAYIFTNKIQHKKNSYKEIVASMAVPAMVSTVFSMGSWLLLTIFGIFGLFGVSAGMILTTFYRYQALIKSTNVEKNKAGYVILAAQLIAIIVIAIAFTAMGAQYSTSIYSNSLF